MGQAENFTTINGCKLRMMRDIEIFAKEVIPHFRVRAKSRVASATAE